MKNFTNPKGFTIIELLISVFMSSLVIVGAFNLQRIFNRSMVNEENISDMQNTVDALRNYTRKITKSAGGGLSGQIIFNNCMGSFETIPPVMIHNNNSYPAVADNVQGGIDNDPDWIEFVVPANIHVDSIKTKVSGKKAALYSLDKFLVNHVVGISVGGKSCLVRISELRISKQEIKFQNSSLCCMNPTNFKHDECGLKNIDSTPSQAVPVTNLGEFPLQALRIDTSNPQRPILMHGIRPLQYGISNYEWSPLADGVEDMQIAFHLDTSSVPDSMGDIWITDRDLLPTEYGKIRAIRFNFVVKSLFAGDISVKRPGFEDRPEGAFDKFKRRSVSFIVKLPNMPISGGAL
jgi:Prokaryotic N-terminal methylation motif